MSLLRHAILPIAFGLILAPATRADDDKKTEAAQGGEQKVWGVVSEVTVLGETDIDYKTRKAITAEATFVTVIGHPSHHDAMHKPDAQASADRDREVKRTSGDSSTRTAERPRHRMNVYVLAVSSKTKVCESSGMPKDGSAAKEAACEIDKLEIGDRVEVTYTPKMMDKTAGIKDDDDKTDADVKPATMKHGRHRTYFGMATDIKIMPEPTEGANAPAEKPEKK